MKDLLNTLNKTPGVLGSAYVRGDEVVSNIGEVLGGANAAPLARRVAEACQEWSAGEGISGFEAATFVGSNGRVLACPAGSGVLVAFSENEASAGLLRLKMREIAEAVGAMAT